MISESYARQFCSEDISKIENYEEAINDKTQTWHCHHILGEILSREQLIDHDFYYKVPSCMLKFVTPAEHVRIHRKGVRPNDETRRKMSMSAKRRDSNRKGVTLSEETRKKLSESHKGKHPSEETRRKMSKSMQGNGNPFYGKHHSDETKRKISESKRHPSAEYRKKLSDAAKRRWASIKK